MILHKIIFILFILIVLASSEMEKSQHLDKINTEYFFQFHKATLFLLCHPPFLISHHQPHHDAASISFFYSILFYILLLKSKWKVDRYKENSFSIYNVVEIRFIYGKGVWLLENYSLYFFYTTSAMIESLNYK